MNDFLNHVHCPICGRPVENETETAYTHIFTPTRCEKLLLNGLSGKFAQTKISDSPESRPLIAWCYNCRHDVLSGECRRCLRTIIHNLGCIEQPHYFINRTTKAGGVA